MRARQTMLVVAAMSVRFRWDDGRCSEGSGERVKRVADKRKGADCEGARVNILEPAVVEVETTGELDSRGAYEVESVRVCGRGWPWARSGASRWGEWPAGAGVRSWGPER